MSPAYVPEVAADYFSELESALLAAPDYGRVYTIFNRVFHRCLDQKAATTQLNLVGTFAKTDYLLKELQAGPALTHDVNDLRTRLRKRTQLADDELQRQHLYDLKTLCRFVALVFSTPVPPSLLSRFPAERRQQPARLLVSDCMRVIVERWDDEYVYAQVEQWTEGDTARICYAHGNRSYDYDWTYLQKILYEGAQLNLIRPRLEGGTLFPELIIFEPDYLIDISTVARCFTNYAESPFVNLINKLQPASNSEAIVLGHFASQLLDEQIHQLPADHTYAQSVADFFRDHAISLLTANVGRDFHDEARRQQDHIRKAIGHSLPEALHRFDPREGIVEPSFFSEMLGLQGRMDYLQLDFKVLLEQKSGKGDFPYDNFQKPRHREEHYVQLLLYMLLIRYNYRAVYEQNHRELHAFLLYSKYADSLLGLGFAPELVFRALKVRNTLAWTERLYTQPDGFRSILESLTPERLNMKHVDNPLWRNFQQPQLAATLAPIHDASPLERAYYFRFLTFIANEHMLSKLGNKTKENSGFASKWHDSLDEKLLAGNIYDRLSLLPPEPGPEGDIRTLTLEFSETADNDMSNFRKGDIVILYPYDAGDEPDVRRTMVFRCTISDITASELKLQLRAPQADARAFQHESEKLWAIEHDFMEASYASLYRGMHAFLSAPKARRDLLLLQRQPEVDTSLKLRGDYGAFNTLARYVRQARELFLIIGPPGTGKTSFGLLNTLREELLDADSSVLLLSFTNRAVDEICSKLTAEGIQFLRVGPATSCAPEYQDYMLSSKVQSCRTLDDLHRLITTTRVFVGTTTAFNSSIALFSLKQFSLAIIDEASQILEPHLIGLLSAQHEGQPAIRKFVLIGDHKQLPAVVQQQQEVSRVSDPLLLDIQLTDCRLSLFERLLLRYEHDPAVTYMLSRQGRMHHDIALFPNHAFYDDRLTEVPLPHQLAALPAVTSPVSTEVSHDVTPQTAAPAAIHPIQALLLSHRVTFIASEPPQADTSEKVNQVEADIIAALVRHIYAIEHDHFSTTQTVGIIVPYRNQIATIRNTLDRFGIPQLHDITIDTVERFQGSQRRYIIYGFTISRYHQLRFLTDNVFIDSNGNIVDRKLNVAMTRAQEHLLLVGNPQLLSRNLTFSRLMQFARDRQSYLQVSRDDFLAGRFNL